MDDTLLIMHALTDRLGSNYRIYSLWNRIWFKDGDHDEIGIEINGSIVTVGYGCSAVFDLSNPRSIELIADAIVECVRHRDCIGCQHKEKRMPDKMREHIATECKGDCDDLCGKMGINYCPLK